MIHTRVYSECCRVVVIIVSLVIIVEHRDTVSCLEGIHKVLAWLEEVATAYTNRPHETVTIVSTTVECTVVMRVLD